MRMSSLPLYGFLLAALSVAAVPARGQSERVYGTRPDKVMVMVSAQFSEDVDKMIWLLPLASAAATETGGLQITLEGKESIALTIPTGDVPAAERASTIRDALGQLLRLEYHPALPAPRGQIDAAWTLSGARAVVAVGAVPMGSRLYSGILSVAPADLPDTGIFARIAFAQNRYHAFVDHVLNGDAHETDTLYDELRAAIDEAQTSLSFYKTLDGRPVTEEHLVALLDRGHVRSAELYWRDAVGKFDTMEPVNEILNNFVRAKAKCPAGTEIVGPYPGVEEERVVDLAVIDEFRRAAARRFLAEAVLCAEAENPWLMSDNLVMFHQEIDAASDVGQRIDPNDFVPEDYETIDAFEAHLARKASGRLNMWERVLAYFQAMQNKNSQNFASPAGR